MTKQILAIKLCAILAAFSRLGVNVTFIHVRMGTHRSLDLF